MKTETERLTDPYGELQWCIGSENDFWCFDYHDHGDGTVTLHAVINSETGSFIQDAETPLRVPIGEAVEQAKRMTYDALEWCSENQIKHDRKGWNQSPSRFWKSVARNI